MAHTSPPRAGPAQGQKGSRRTRVADAVLACILGIVFLAPTLAMGLGWSGWTYTAAVTQSVIAIFLTAPIALLASRSWWAYLVPFLSAVLTGMLIAVGEQIGHTGA